MPPSGATCRPSPPQPTSANNRATTASHGRTKSTAEHGKPRRGRVGSDATGGPRGGQSPSRARDALRPPPRYRRSAPRRYRTSRRSASTRSPSEPNTPTQSSSSQKRAVDQLDLERVVHVAVPSWIADTLHVPRIREVDERICGHADDRLAARAVRLLVCNAHRLRQRPHDRENEGEEAERNDKATNAHRRELHGRSRSRDTRANSAQTAASDHVPHRFAIPGVANQRRARASYRRSVKRRR